MNAIIIPFTVALFAWILYWKMKIRYENTMTQMAEENDKLQLTLEKHEIRTELDVHLPRKDQYTAILEFVVLHPQNDLETVGEKLQLSTFGEYCPDRSLRGYRLHDLLVAPENYRPIKIVQMGEVVEIEIDECE